jgi:hypothetical protein
MLHLASVNIIEDKPVSVILVVMIIAGNKNADKVICLLEFLIRRI